MVGWSAVLVLAEGVCENEAFPCYLTCGLGLYGTEGEPERVRGLWETGHPEVRGRNRFRSVRSGVRRG